MQLRINSNFKRISYLFYRAMHYSAKRVSRSHVVCPSVCQSVSLWRWWIVIT